jgi:hypothetical protein
VRTKILNETERACFYRHRQSVPILHLIAGLHPAEIRKGPAVNCLLHRLLIGYAADTAFIHPFILLYHSLHNIKVVECWVDAHTEWQNFVKKTTCAFTAACSKMTIKTRINLSRRHRMKAPKKVLSLILMLALSMTLSIPGVSAAEEQPEGEMTINTKAEPTIPANKSYRLRGVTEETTSDDEIYKLVRETETTPYTLDSVYNLSLGTVLTFNSWSITLEAWSDPDGDGIYDIRICSKDGTPLPVSAPGPFVANPETGDYASTTFSVLGNNWVSRLSMPDNDVCQLSAAYLTRMFGSNTIVQISTDDSHCFFILTGEKADPALLTGSNILITDAGSVASNWAAPLVSQAESQKLVPDTLYGLDLTQNITRGQFAGVAVKLYESMSGKKIPLPGENKAPFEDIDDIAECDDIQKAFAMEFTTGTSATTFSPNSLLNREQAATMLSRVYQKLGGTVSAQASGSFADNSAISPWARDAVYFMSKNGIVQGVGENRFDPQSNAQSQMALVISLRMLQKLK